MNNYFRQQGERSYVYDNKIPYSAADLLLIDEYLDYDFTGNAIEQLLERGVASYDGKHLHLAGVAIKMVNID